MPRRWEQVHPQGLAASNQIAANCKIAYSKTARLQDCMDYQGCKTTWTARLLDASVLFTA
jgi:hypothetical protein